MTCPASSGTPTHHWQSGDDVKPLMHKYSRKKTMLFCFFLIRKPNQLRLFTRRKVQAIASAQRRARVRAIGSLEPISNPISFEPSFRAIRDLLVGRTAQNYAPTMCMLNCATRLARHFRSMTICND